MKARLTPALRRAYRMTRYESGGVTVRIGRRCPALDVRLAARGQRDAVFITAWNPLSRRMPDGWNRRMQRRLVQSAGRFALFPACGWWRRWSELHVLLFINAAPALVLARRYRQHAIVIVRKGQPARLAMTYLDD